MYHSLRVLPEMVSQCSVLIGTEIIFLCIVSFQALGHYRLPAPKKMSLHPLAFPKEYNAAASHGMLAEAGGKGWRWAGPFLY